jgi:hypothetical protein
MGDSLLPSCEILWCRRAATRRIVKGKIPDSLQTPDLLGLPPGFSDICSLVVAHVKNEAP